MKGTGSNFEDERELIESLRNGDEAGFETVVRKHGPRMLAVARRYFSEEQDARDTVQDAMISAFKGIHNFAGEAQLSTWLHRIVVNASLMRLRIRRRRREHSLEDLPPHFDDKGNHLRNGFGVVSDLDGILERTETMAIVRKCMGMLPESYRVVLVLRDIEGVCTEDVARALNTSPDAIKVRLHRAHQALRTILQRGPLRAQSRSALRHVT